MHNAHLAIKTKKANKYPMLIKPEIWANTWGDVPKKLFMVVIELKPTKRLSKPYSPIAFLTRTSMPAFPTFPVFLDDNIETSVVSTRVASSIPLTQTLLSQLAAFTFLIFADCFNKTYEHDLSRMSYWLAPMKENWKTQSSIAPINVLDQELLGRIANDEGILYPNVQFHDFPASLFTNLIVDPNSGKYRYFPIDFEQSLTADGPVPKHMPPRRKAMQSLLHYTCSLYGGAKDKFMLVANKNQPVLKTELVSIRRNVLDRMSDAEKDMVTEYYVCPQPLKVSAVSGSPLEH
jgi:endoribonuclease Dicer